MEQDKHESENQQPTPGSQSYGELVKSIVKAVIDLVKAAVKEWTGTALAPLHKLKKGCLVLAAAGMLLAVGVGFLAVAAFLGLAYLLHSYGAALAVSGALCLIIAAIVLHFGFKQDDSESEPDEDPAPSGEIDQDDE